MHRTRADSTRIDPADFAACRRLLRNGSRSFHAASFLLPRDLAEPATALYAFCRVADDVVDEGAARAGCLSELRRRLDLAYAGTPHDAAADRALASVVRGFGLPREIPDALIEGFEWDLAGRRYASFEQLEAYALRVAGSVGIMMAWLMGARTPALLARAADLGIAMQLTNIARDVGEDARNGRLYLPEDALRAEGIDPVDWLREPRFCPAIARVNETLLARAAALYRRADAGINALPVRFRAGIRAARSLYAEIGTALERRGFDSVASRCVVGMPRKLALLARSIAPYPAPGGLGQRPLPVAARLIDSIAEEPVAAAHTGEQGRLGAVLDLFARLEAIDRRRGRSLTRVDSGLAAMAR